VSSTAKTRRAAKPLLADAMKMRQPEFHRLYEQFPESVKIELIDGVVYMATPASGGHGLGTLSLNGLFFYYSSLTPGVTGGDNMTTILGWDCEPQPDAMLRLLPECGGQSQFNEGGYLVGAPELICEVAVTTLRLDLGKKLEMYERYGVQEYIVFDARHPALHWMQFPSREPIHPDARGIYKSNFFPGLWIDSKALARNDAAAMIAAVDKGTKTAAHRKFVQKLKSLRAEARR
jgi:Uma2 family endonuclease